MLRHHKFHAHFNLEVPYEEARDRVRCDSVLLPEGNRPSCHTDNLPGFAGWITDGPSHRKPGDGSWNRNGGSSDALTNVRTHGRHALQPRVLDGARWDHGAGRSGSTGGPCSQEYVPRRQQLDVWWR